MIVSVCWTEMCNATLRDCFISMKIKNGGATCHLKKKLMDFFHVWL